MQTRLMCSFFFFGGTDLNFLRFCVSIVSLGFVFVDGNVVHFTHSRILECVVSVVM